MTRPVGTIGLLALAFAAAAILIALVIPGCTQNQANSPISISNSQGRPALSVTCSADGSIAYVTDGRNVYRYDPKTSEGIDGWECVLSQDQRMELAVKHDPREQSPTPSR